MEKRIALLSVFLFLSAIIVVCIDRFRMRRMVTRMNRMLDAAIKGEFVQERFDESLVSSLESKMMGFLSASCLSFRNQKEEKEKIKEWIADISHQTKTPIANILLYAQLLEEQKLSEENRECVKALYEQAEKLNFLITSLVKLSRLETGVLKLYPKKDSLCVMLKEIKMQYAPKAKEKGIQFWVEDTKEKAVFDRKWTEEAIGNLVDNAIKYTPKEGNIWIFIESYELFCRIIIKDTGIGIREEEQAKVFERFYRSRESDETEGVGIGLYLTRQILTEEGGYLKLFSESGKGTEISAYLPR